MTPIGRNRAIMAPEMEPLPPPRVESLKVENFRALRNIEFTKLEPLTLLLGPNGSGKSTIFDVFAFLSECFTDGLRKAWDRRGRFKELRSRGSDGNILFEIKYRERPGTSLITYHLEIAELKGGPALAHEFLRWKRTSPAAPFHFLTYRFGEGEVRSGEQPEPADARVSRPLASYDVLAVNTLGQLAENPRVIALRNFIASWHLSYLTADATRAKPEVGTQERLSQSGDNLPNVIQYLSEQHPARLEQIFATLRRRVPQLERVDAMPLLDGSLLLLVKDAPFPAPFLSRFVSNGTLKMLAYLTVLYDPHPPQLIGIEEPENYLHPKLLPELAGECLAASDRSQLIVTTHSPFFVDALQPKQVWVLFRTSNGYAQTRRVADMPGIDAFMAQGASLGDLWMEGQFDVGNPFSPGA